MEITLKPSPYFALCILAMALISVHTTGASLSQKPTTPVIKQFIEAAQKGDNKTLEKVYTEHGNSLLHKASQNGHTEVVELFLTADANTELCNKDGKTPLQLATEKGYTEVVVLLT